MADFLPAFEKMITNEGGYTLHNVPGDAGGLTYAGIAQNFHRDWEGWALLATDPENPELTDLVRIFYRIKFWNKIKGDDIVSQWIAGSLFDFAVNAGVSTSSKLAQVVIGASPDGIIGNISLGLLNSMNEELFISNYALAKITRYAQIVTNDDTQRKFLLGWINRTLEGLS